MEGSGPTLKSELAVSRGSQGVHAVNEEILFLSKNEYSTRTREGEGAKSATHLFSWISKKTAALRAAIFGIPAYNVIAYLV